MVDLACSLGVYSVTGDGATNRIGPPVRLPVRSRLMLLFSPHDLLASSHAAWGPSEHLIAGRQRAGGLNLFCVTEPIEHMAEPQ
jgi:hypothetical protein